MGTLKNDAFLGVLLMNTIRNDRASGQVWENTRKSLIGRNSIAVMAGIPVFYAIYRPNPSISVDGVAWHPALGVPVKDLL